MIEATVAIMRLAAGKGLAFLIKVVATSPSWRGVTTTTTTAPCSHEKQHTPLY